MSSSDDEVNDEVYDEEEDDDFNPNDDGAEEYEEDEESDEEEDGAVVDSRARRGAGGDDDVGEEEGEDEDEDDDEEGNEDDYYVEEEEEYNEDEDYAKMEARVSSLVADGQVDEAVDALKSLTSSLAAKLPDLKDLDDDDVGIHKSYVIGAMSLWVELLHDDKTRQRFSKPGATGASVIDDLNTWSDTFLGDECLELDVTDAADDDKAVIKEFIEVLEECKEQPAKKKQKA